MSSIRFWFVVAVLASVNAGAQVPLELRHTFTGPDGVGPQGVLLWADGSFYGTARYGGEAGFGTIFKMKETGEFTVLHSFESGSDGAYPMAGLIKATDGSLYGTTLSGGDLDLGTVFRMTPAGDVTVLHEFEGGSDGALPGASLIQATDGNFYGTTGFGGRFGLGTLFRMTPAGAVTVLRGFAGVPPDPTPFLPVLGDGATPQAGLIQASDGFLYGTTVDGGQFDLGFPAGHGTIFRIALDGTSYQVVRYFQPLDLGEHPKAALVQASDGNLYGTTFTGGPAYGVSRGTVFKLDPQTLGVTPMHTFGSDEMGGFLYTSLIQGLDGNLYGTTGSTAFKMTTSGQVTLLYQFTGADGRGPMAALAQAPDGTFYGVTTGGGPAFSGIVFRLDTLMCRDSLDTLVLFYQNPIFRVSFTLQTPIPATWSTWLVSSAGVTNLWSLPIPAVSPAMRFAFSREDVPPGVWLGFLTTLSTPSGVTCFDWKTVNTSHP
jgi:uncharacterized repeat protein (TIGR03803 family)